MPDTTIGVSNLTKVKSSSQQDSNEALTSIPGSNIVYGKRGREEGIFHKRGNNYSLIRGKRLLTGSSYYYIGSERTRDDGLLIYPTIPKVISLYENDQLIYKGGIKDGLCHWAWNNLQRRKACF